MFGLWLAIALFLAMVEFGHQAILFILFAAGAVVAALVSLAVTALAFQVAVFVAASLLLVIFARPVLQRVFNVHKEVRPSNVDSYLGKQAVVTKPISHLSFGQVRLDGSLWTAESDADIAVGAKVEVAGVEGVRLVVHPVINS